MLVCTREGIISDKIDLLKKKPRSRKSPFKYRRAKATVSSESLICRIFASLERNSKDDPSRVAVVDGTYHERRLTNGELRHYALATASFLRSCGFGRGDRALIAIRNTVEFPIFHLGVWAAGGIVVGANAAFKAHETQYQLFDSSPKIVLCTQDCLSTIIGVLSPSVEKVICIRNTDIDLPEGIIDFIDVISHMIDGEAPLAYPDDVALICYTSGTTGLRKGVLHTHASCHAAAESVRSHFAREIYPALGLNERSIKQEYHMLTSACGHLMGFNLLNVFLISGAPIVMLADLQDGTLPRCIEQYKPPFLIGSPAMVMCLTKVEACSLSSVKLVATNGSYLRKSVAEAFLRRYPHVEYVIQGYGLTELSFSHLPVLFHRGYNSSAGVVASMFRRKIINTETNEMCKQGEHGQVFLKGPAQTIGYLNRPERDLGFVDELGQLHIVDRMKEMMKVNHKNGTSTVPPSEIESAIMSCAKVADVGVVGIPHEERESLIRAFVVRADDSLTAEEVETVVSDKLCEYKFITGGVRFIDAIPRSPAGKLLRMELRNLAQMD